MYLDKQIVSHLLLCVGCSAAAAAQDIDTLFGQQNCSCSCANAGGQRCGAQHRLLAASAAHPADIKGLEPRILPIHLMQ